MVPAYIPSWPWLLCSMQKNLTTTILTVSLEDKALKGGALMQDFPIYTHFQLISSLFSILPNISVLIRLVMVSWHRLLVVNGN